MTCSDMIKRIPWQQVYGATSADSKIGWESWKDDYRESSHLMMADMIGPDSGIVNFYQLKDTLMGHADRAEYASSINYLSIRLMLRLDPSRPLISISYIDFLQCR